MTDAHDSKASISRRRLLQLTGAGAIAATAGCSGILGDDGGVPGYASYVPVAEQQVDGGGFVAYMDYEALEELPESSEDSSGGSMDDQLPEDPLLAYPFSGAFGLLFFAGFSLAGAGLGDLIDDETDTFDSEMDELLWTDTGIVLTGDFDTDEIAEALTGSGGEENAFAVSYEEADEIDGYTVYETPNEDSESNSYAVGSDEIFGAEPGKLERAIETANGDGDRAHNEFDEFEWLLSETSDGMIVTAVYSEDGDISDEDEQQDSGGGDGGFGGTDQIEGANGVAGALSFDGDAEEVSATLAASFEDLDDETQDQIEESLGAEAENDADISVDGDRVTAEATYSQDALEDS